MSRSQTWKRDLVIWASLYLCPTNCQLLATLVNFYASFHASLLASGVEEGPGYPNLQAKELCAIWLSATTNIFNVIQLLNLFAPVQRKIKKS